MPDPVPVSEMKLRPELMLAVCRALNFDPATFALRHAKEFTRQYLRADKMLSYAGDVIAHYLVCQVNECLSKAEYALLSYIEYAGRAEADQDERDAFNEAVARYLSVRCSIGNDWVYAFEGENPKPRCMETYPQLYTMAHAMHAFSQSMQDLKTVAQTYGPDAWPDPKRVMPTAPKARL